MLAALGVVVSLAGACASTGAEAGSGSTASHTLRSSRRLHFLVAAPREPVRPGSADELGEAVTEEMTGLGFSVADDPHQPFDVEVRLALAPPGEPPPARGHAQMQALAAGVVLDEWSVDTGSPGAAATTASSVKGAARDLVADLARSERVSAYADRLYGRRLRPLRETVGRRSHVFGDQGGTPPLESLGRAVP